MQNNPAGGDGANGQAPAHVLVVDDDPTVAEVVAGYLARAGHDVARAADGPSALDRFARRRPDLVVLDLMLPGMDGFEVCRRMREQGGPVPVIMLTARGDEEDRVLGLETGADDYVTKPFSPRELVLRVESVLRRVRLPVPAPGTSPAAGVLRTATLALDPVARRATREGAELALTLREFDLLTFFLRHPGRAFSREELMSEVWGWDFGDLSTVTVHVRRLRAKIEHDPARPSLIQTVWGVGYRLADGGVGVGVDGGTDAGAGAAGGASAAGPPRDGWAAQGPEDAARDTPATPPRPPTPPPGAPVLPPDPQHGSPGLSPDRPPEPSCAPAPQLSPDSSPGLSRALSPDRCPGPAPAPAREPSTGPSPEPSLGPPGELSRAPAPDRSPGPAPEPPRVPSPAPSTEPSPEPFPEPSPDSRRAGRS